MHLKLFRSLCTELKHTGFIFQFQATLRQHWDYKLTTPDYWQGVPLPVHTTIV